MKVDVQYAEEHIADLIAAALGGEEVEIAVPEKAGLVLKAKGAVGAASSKSRKDLLGAGEGLITLPTDEEWAAMDKEIEAEMLSGSIFPPEADETAA